MAHRTWLRVVREVPRLPELARRLTELEKRLKRLEEEK
jgi:UDP-3-O-[3-hydroxymyristoyl] glucosamine N-acyltransferase